MKADALLMVCISFSFGSFHELLRAPILQWITRASILTNVQGMSFFCHNIYFLLLMSSLHWTATKIWRSDSTMSGVCKSNWRKFIFI
jgi:hypothetical protein